MATKPETQINKLTQTLIKNFQLNIDFLLGEKQMTRSELAKKMKVGRSSVTDQLSDRYENLTINKVTEYAMAFGWKRPEHLLLPPGEFLEKYHSQPSKRPG